MRMIAAGDFADRYGPWAFVAGASEGIGAAYARRIAADGVNVVISSRRREVLEAVADEIRADTAAEVRVAPLDLTSPALVDELERAVADLEIGLVTTRRRDRLVGYRAAARRRLHPSTSAVAPIISPTASARRRWRPGRHHPDDVDGGGCRRGLQRDLRRHQGVRPPPRRGVGSSSVSPVSTSSRSSRTHRHAGDAWSRHGSH
jgi:uncharacterized protein YbjT (DUF2867 family)